jgi:hypothetical protein
VPWNIARVIFLTPHKISLTFGGSILNHCACHDCLLNFILLPMPRPFNTEERANVLPYTRNTPKNA